MGKIKSRKQIMKVLKDVQEAIEEFQAHEVEQPDEYIYRGWEEALNFVLGDADEKHLKKIKK
jgi:hypothetical protein